MIHLNRRAVLLSGACLLASPVVVAAAPKPTATGPTALDRYVAKKDSVYGWTLASSIKGAGYVTYVLNLTSQTWRSAAERQDCETS